MVRREDRGDYRSILFFYSFFWSFLSFPIGLTFKYKYHFSIVKGQCTLLLLINPAACHLRVLRRRFPLDVCLFYGTLEQFFMWSNHELYPLLIPMKGSGDRDAYPYNARER